MTIRAGAAAAFARARLAMHDAELTLTGRPGDFLLGGTVAGAVQAGDRVVLTRYAADFLLVRNPKHSEWHALRRKLRWGEGPNMH